MKHQRIAYMIQMGGGSLGLWDDPQVATVTGGPASQQHTDFELCVTRTRVSGQPMNDSMNELQTLPDCEQLGSYINITMAMKCRLPENRLGRIRKSEFRVPELCSRASSSSRVVQEFTAQ
jgi:hypothetical protein